MTLLGISLSLITMLLWSIDIIVSRIAITQYEGSPAIFACVMLLSAAVILIIIGGSGQKSLKTIKSPYSWAYGVTQIIANIFTISALAYITNTELTLLYRFNILISLVIGTVFFARSMGKADVWGSFIILLCIIFVSFNLPPETRNIALFLCFIGCFTQVVRTVIAETHPISDAKDTIRDRCQVAGYVMFITSFMFLAVTYTGAVLKAEMSVEAINKMPFLAQMPTFEDVMNINNYAFGIPLGVLIYGPGVYFYFWATKVSKTENFTIAITFMPVVTYVLEMLVSTTGLLDVSNIGTSDLAAGGIIVITALLMILMRRKKAVSKAGA